MEKSAEHSEQLRAQVESDIADVTFRQPVVDEDTSGLNRAPVSAQDRRVDYDWLAVTEAARRAITTSPDARRKATTFAADPLSESLPQKAVQELADVDPRVARLAKLTKKTLGVVLEYSPVSEELLTPDIKHSPILQRREDVVAGLVERKARFPQEYDTALQRARGRIEKFPGVTEAERKLVGRRYRYAREVKLLGLMAELHDQPVAGTEVRDGLIAHTLESGTKVVMTGEAFEQSPALLNPEYWQGRRQLKDRVYAVSIDDKEYIMKERKTDRHLDTMSEGHRDGLTSQQEFEVARKFADLGVIKRGDIELRWEKPLGYVEFPDGFQFCLFESEPDLQMQVSQTLADAIKEASSEYAEEFSHTRERAKQIYDERKDLIGGFIEDDMSGEPGQLGDDELSFDEFAYLKAYHLVQEAGEMLGVAVLERGYNNGDTDDYAFRIRKGDRPVLEIIGFDFEYFRKIPRIAERALWNMQRARQDGSAAMGRAFRFTGSRGIEVAASYSILEDMDFPLPKVERAPTGYF